MPLDQKIRKKKTAQNTQNNGANACISKLRRKIAGSLVAHCMGDMYNCDANHSSQTTACIVRLTLLLAQGNAQHPAPCIVKSYFQYARAIKHGTHFRVS